MEEAKSKFILNNIGIFLMWMASTAISWKILDRPSGWVIVAVVVIIMSAGVSTAQILNAGVERVARKVVKN